VFFEFNLTQATDHLFDRAEEQDILFLIEQNML